MPDRVIVRVSTFGWSPDHLEAKKGEPLALVIRTTDIEHGFYQPDLDILTPIPVGEDVGVELVFSDAGEYVFYSDRTQKADLSLIEGTITVR